MGNVWCRQSGYGRCLPGSRPGRSQRWTTLATLNTDWPHHHSESKAPEMYAVLDVSHHKFATSCREKGYLLRNYAEHVGRHDVSKWRHQGIQQYTEHDRLLRHRMGHGEARAYRSMTLCRTINRICDSPRSSSSGSGTTCEPMGIKVRAGSVSGSGWTGAPSNPAASEHQAGHFRSSRHVTSWDVAKWLGNTEATGPDGPDVGGH